MAQKCREVPGTQNGLGWQPGEDAGCRLQLKEPLGEQGLIQEGGVKTGMKRGPFRGAEGVRRARDGGCCGQRHDGRHVREDWSGQQQTGPQGRVGVSDVQKEGWSSAGKGLTRP